jgi:hypothetical protein
MPRAVGVTGSKTLLVPEAVVQVADAPYAFIGVGAAALVGVALVMIGITVLRNRRVAAARAQQHDSVRMFDLADKRGSGSGVPLAIRDSRLDQPSLAGAGSGDVAPGPAPAAQPDLCLPR